MESKRPPSVRLRLLAVAAARGRRLAGAGLLALLTLGGGTLAIGALDDGPAPPPSTARWDGPEPLPRQWQWDPPTHGFDHMVRGR